MHPKVQHLILGEAGSSVAELALFAGLLVLAGAGFFCFSANQFRDAFQSSYRMK